MQPTSDSSLPERWVQKIFTALRATYGASFDRQWEAPQCPPSIDLAEHLTKHASEMMAVWGRGLRGFQQNPNAIAHALDNLPEFPPNLIQFAALCRSRPEPPLVAIDPDEPKPKADPQRVAEVMGAIKRPAAPDPKAWANRMRDAERTGARLTMAQRDMWRAAIGALPQPTLEGST